MLCGPMATLCKRYEWPLTRVRSSPKTDSRWRISLRIGRELIRDSQTNVALCFATVLLRNAAFAERWATLLESQPRRKDENAYCLPLPSANTLAKNDFIASHERLSARSL